MSIISLLVAAASVAPPAEGDIFAEYFLNAATIGGNALAMDASDDTVLAGSLGAAGMVLKVDVNGILQWGKTYTDGEFSGVAIGSDGAVHCCSLTGAIVKYNTSGVVVWKKSYGFSGVPTVILNGIALDADDNVYVVGYYSTNNSPIVAKFNSSGVLQWQRMLGASSVSGWGIAADSSGVYVAAGERAGAMYVYKHSLAGVLQWQRTGSNAGGESICLDSSHNVYVVCSKTTQGLRVVKYDSSGALQWQRTISTIAPASEGASKVPVWCAYTDALYLSARHRVSSTRYAYVAKYNAAGAIQWQRTLDGGDYTGGNGIAVNGDLFRIGGDSDGVTGMIASFPTDGTHTGTRTIWTYAAASEDEAAGTMTDAAGSAVDAAGTATVNTGSGVEGSFTPTTTRVYL